MQETVITPGLYKHYSGSLYQVLGVSRHSETLEILVVYQALQGDYALWCRPLSLFLETVEHEGVSTPRFAFLSAPVCQAAQVR